MFQIQFTKMNILTTHLIFLLFIKHMQFLLAKACSPEWCNYTITKINGTEYNLSLNCNETNDIFYFILFNFIYE